MTSDANKTRQELDTFFAAAATEPGPSDDLVARVLADAVAVQTAAALPAAPAPYHRPGWLEAIGGWITVSGLAAACAAGIAIGIALPGVVGAGLDGTFLSVLEGRQTLGFASLDAVAFAEDGL